MIRTATLSVALAACSTSDLAWAQATYSHENVSLAAAESALDKATADARAVGHRVSVVVLDTAGHTVAIARMDGASHTSLQLATQKAHTALALGRPTQDIHARLQTGDNTILSIEGMIAVPGGVPVRTNDNIVGSIGVSGAPPTVDHEIAASAAVAAQH